MLLRLQRREFLGILATYAAATGLLVMAGRTPSLRLVRPPGALPEDQFMQSCLRCNACVDICPVKGLSPANLMDGLGNIGTPALAGYCMVFRELEKPGPEATSLWKKSRGQLGSEDACFECIKVCPSGALRAVNASHFQMGVAHVDKDLCKAWRYGNCTFPCITTCPFDAISMTAGPVIDENRCVGCNQCSVVCVVRPTAIKVEPKQK